MIKMYSDVFENEIQAIQSEDFRDFVRFYFDEKVGEWFKKSGASSTGNFHPKFCLELLRMNTYAYMKDTYKDYAIMACLLHDTCKYGTGNDIDKTCYPIHGELAAEQVAQAWFEFFGAPAPELLCMAIRSHMGQWVENKENRPFTNIDRLVHLSDYIASRNFIDIPQITDEWADKGYSFVDEEFLDIEEDSLPF